MLNLILVLRIVKIVRHLIVSIKRNNRFVRVIFLNIQKRYYHPVVCVGVKIKITQRVT